MQVQFFFMLSVVWLNLTCHAPLVIPKSSNEERIKANLVYFKIDQEDIDAIIDLEKDQTIRAL